MHAAEHKFTGSPPHELSLCEAATAIAGGDLTSEALVAACLNRVEVRDSAVGAAKSATAKWADEAMLNGEGKAHRARRDI